MRNRHPLALKLLLSLVVVGMLASRVVGGWTKESSWSELQEKKTTGDLVGNNGFRDVWIIEENGNIWGQHGSACSGHSFGPAGPDTWDSSTNNSLTTTWTDEEPTQGAATIRLTVAYEQSPPRTVVRTEWSYVRRDIQDARE